MFLEFVFFCFRTNAPTAVLVGIQLKVLLESVREKCNINAPIAQLVELLPLKEKVVGSNPTGRTVSLNAGVVKWQTRLP